MTRKNLKSKNTRNVYDNIDNCNISDDDENHEKNLYNVEKIVDKKIFANGEAKYQVKWEGYPDSKNTWEPLENLLYVIEMVEQFEVLLVEKEKEKFSLEIVSTWQNDDVDVKDSNIKINEPKQKNLLPDNDDEDAYSKLSKTQKRKKIVEQYEEEVNLLSKIDDEDPKDRNVLEENNKDDFEYDKNQLIMEGQNNEDKKINKNDKKIESKLNLNADKKEIKKLPKKKLLPLEGHFKYKDKPKQIILAVSKKDSCLRFKLSWYPRADGTIPFNSSFTSEQIREFDPIFLLDYYESKVVLCPKKSRNNNEQRPNSEEELQFRHANVVDTYENKKNCMEFLSKSSKPVIDEVIRINPIDKAAAWEEEQETKTSEEKQRVNNNNSIRDIDISEDYHKSKDISKDVSVEREACYDKSLNFIENEIESLC